MLNFRFGTRRSSSELSFSKLLNALDNILAELNVLFDAYENALRLEDYESARTLGEKLFAFIDYHGEDLKLTKEQVIEINDMRRNIESKWITQRLAESRLANLPVDAEEALEKYYQILLEQEPHGRKRTAH